MNPKKQQKGTLYLIPSALGEAHPGFVPPYVLELLQQIPHFLVERPRTARRFLRAIDPDFDLHGIEMHTLDKRTSPREKERYLQPLQKGKDVGVLSEAGSPGIADPGYEMVQLAHRHHIRVVPLIGPSSVTLALMASGLPGQNFAFWGYLSRKQKQRADQLQMLENQSRKYNQTQLFMEAPYRNQKILQAAVRHLQPNTLFGVAANLTLSDEYIKTQPIKGWKGQLPDLHKQPAIFLIYAGE